MDLAMIICFTSFALQLFTVQQALIHVNVSYIGCHGTTNSVNEWSYASWSQDQQMYGRIWKEQLWFIRIIGKIITCTYRQNHHWSKISTYMFIITKLTIILQQTTLMWRNYNASRLQGLLQGVNYQWPGCMQATCNYAVLQLVIWLWLLNIC